MVTTVELVSFAVLSAIAYRRRRDRFWAVMAAAATVGLASDALAGRLFAQSSVGPWQVALFIPTFIAAAEAFGLPRPIAQRIGLGLRSRAWEYDRALSDLLQPIGDEIKRKPPADEPARLSSWLARLERDGERRVTRAARLRAPDAEWAALIVLYVRIYRSLFRLHAGEPLPGDEAVQELIDEANAERQRLRAVYRAEAGELGSG